MRTSRRPAAAVPLLAAALVAGVLTTACGGGDGGTSGPTTGRALFRAYCSTCHGTDGQGGVGPRLAGVVADKYPDIDDQIRLVTNGTGRMPSFRGSLSAEEIRTIVVYERTKLGT